jgi:hypothetical protein
LPELLNQISSHISHLKESECRDESTKKKVFSQIEIINQKLNPKKIEVAGLLNRIFEKESKITKRMSKEFSLKESLDTSFCSNDSVDYLDSQHNYYKQRTSFESNHIVVKDVQDNINYLNKRQEELEEIKKVSGQIKELSENMVVDVQKQGDNLQVINLDIIEVKENAHKAEIEIEIAEKESKTLMKRKLCWFLLMCFVLTSFISIVVLLYLGKKTN